MTTPKLKDSKFEGHQTARDYSGSKCLHQLFAEQAALTPDAIAVKFNDQGITYAELNDRANRLARTLLNRGVGRETLIGICVERSPEMIVGLLGILKAGAAYVPLDPSYPEQRLAYIAEDAQAVMTLTGERWLDRLPRRAGRRVCLDRDWEEISLRSEENPERGVGPDNLAYV